MLATVEIIKRINKILSINCKINCTLAFYKKTSQHSKCVQETCTARISFLYTSILSMSAKFSELAFQSGYFFDYDIPAFS